MPRPRLVLAAIVGLVLTVPLGGCPLEGLNTPPTLSGGSLGFVKTNVDPAKTSVAVGETLTLWVDTSLPAGGLSYQWSATGGSLSSFSDRVVQWTADGAPGQRVRVVCVVSSGTDTRQAEYLFTIR